MSIKAGFRQQERGRTEIARIDYKCALKLVAVSSALCRVRLAVIDRAHTIRRHYNAGGSQACPRVATTAVSETTFAVVLKPFSAEPKWHQARAVSSLAKQVRHFNERASGTEHITATDPRHGLARTIRRRVKSIHGPHGTSPNVEDAMQSSLPTTVFFLAARVTSVFRS
jgi:hypothetical protein